MNRPNIAALGLLVGAQTFFLFGLLFAAFPLLRSPMGILEQETRFLGPNVQAPFLFEHVADNMPWLLSILFFPLFAVPAGFLFLGSFSIWRFLGRRRWLADKKDALIQKDMESVLQRVLTEMAESLDQPRESARENLFAGMANVVHRLDPRRQYRLFWIFRESGLGDGWMTTPPTVAPARGLSHQQRELLARVTVLGFFLVSAFMMLWGLLALVFQPQMQFMKSALGIQVEPVDALMVVAFCSVLAGIPFTSGLGLLWLSHLDGKLRDFRASGLGLARNVLVDGYRSQMHTLYGQSAEVPLGVGRALTSCALLELDAPGKRRVIECVTELGLATRSELLDAGVANLSGVDLSEMDLAGAHLEGFQLNGARLCGTNLTSANLTGANLFDADLRRAVLDGACLRGADLRSARLHSAQLRRADLTSAHLEGANLWQANLMDADLTDCGIDAKQLATAQPRTSIPARGSQHA